MNSNNSILAEITNTPKSLMSSLSDNLPTENIKIDNPKSIFDYGMKIIRIVLIIYIISYIILTILNHFKLLSDWLENLFEPLDIISTIKKIRKKNENDKTIKTSNEKLATQIEADEEIAPSQFVPETNNGIKTSITPEPDNSSSSTQSSKIANKAGYCYIGEDRGFRSCIKIDEGDNCMSGNIFPSEALCINPNLRT